MTHTKNYNLCAEFTLNYLIFEMGMSTSWVSANRYTTHPRLAHKIVLKTSSNQNISVV